MSEQKLQPSDFTDAKLSERVAREVLINRFCWVAGLGWLRWDGKRWVEAPEEDVIEVVRLWVVDNFDRAVQLMRRGGDDTVVKWWLATLGGRAISAVVKFAKGIDGVKAEARDFDAHSDMLNVDNGVVALPTGQVIKHDPSLKFTKITKGRYRPGYKHPDWEVAITALDEPTRTWFQTRIGQAITGHRTPDGVLPVLQGGGNNGKSALTTDGLLPALGDYADPASTKLFLDKNEHSTERADLRGTRLLVAEELTEGRAINVTALKQIQDLAKIKARKVHKDNFVFTTTHSLFCTTNYKPVVAETDWGTWRRLALVVFPYRYVSPPPGAEPDWAPTGPNERRGDPTLKARIENGQEQADAAVTWAVEGAMRWYADQATSLALPDQVERDTRAWRATADRILGYWDARLIADKGACILTTDILLDFNAWMQATGHNDWTKELFGARFAEHTETVGHRVVRARPSKALEGLARPRIPTGVLGLEKPLPPVPSRPEVWLSVRYRTPVDDAEDAAKAAAEEGSEDAAGTLAASAAGTLAAAAEGGSANGWPAGSPVLRVPG